MCIADLQSGLGELGRETIDDLKQLETIMFLGRKLRLG